MKKIAIVLGVTLIGSANHGFYGSQLIQREYDEYTQPQFLDASNPNDEYVYVNIDGDQAIEVIVDVVDIQSDVAEYDQHICDEVTPPKVSATEAWIKEMLGFVLVQYITLKEITHAYCQEIKQTLQKWFSTLA
jgi:hypothetical protein